MDKDANTNRQKRRESDVDGRGRRDFEDQERDRQVYRYLLALSDLTNQGKSNTPNETSIAQQWGVEDNRIFIRRVLRSVLTEVYAKKEGKEPPPVPGLTLSKLVSILSALQAHQRKQHSLAKDKDKKAFRLITRAEKLKALRLFFQLSAEERDQLDLPVHAGNALINQIVEEASDQTVDYKEGNIRLLYDYFQRLEEGSSGSLADALENSGDPQSRQNFIYKTVTKYAKPYLEGLDKVEKDDKTADFTKKVEREIDRVALQSGLEQAYNYPEKASYLNDERLHDYLSVDFVRRLVKSVVENELITDEFPIYIKYFKVERARPLPLYIKQEGEDKSFEAGLLNSFLLKDGQSAQGVQGLERQVAYRVRVHFFIKLPDDYKPRFPNITTTTEMLGQKRLNFSEEVVGVGCPTLHITAAINRALFWDIPMLEGYLPIVDAVHCEDQLVGNRPNSPVWSHCVARLYEREDVETALKLGKPCTTVSDKAEVASADFCGFDLLETAAKAALHARLKLIKQILANQPTVNAGKYIKQLCYRVEEMIALKQGQQYLTFYPFSMRAMEGSLEDTVFSGGKYRLRKPDYTFEEEQPGKCWSVVALDAQLSIAEANLKEGLLHIARKYIEILSPYLEGEENGKVGDLLIVRYHLCWFRYHYLGDLEDSTAIKYPDRYVAVRKAEEQLEKAERRLQERLGKYEELDELPQSNLHPQFYLLSRIYAHRAKLYIFFSNYMRKLNRWETLLEPVKLLEKARIYAARDGEPALYAQWSAYQSWCYIMLAYLGGQEGAASKEFGAEKCLDWAVRLVDHAILCYSETGKTCYQQIKDGGGQTTPVCSPKEAARPHDSFALHPIEPPKYYEKYGRTLIEVIPLIRELSQNESESQEYKQGHQRASNVVDLDVSLIKKVERENRSTYLFGMQSCILLFAKGMLVLCDKNNLDEELVEAIRTKALRMFNYCQAIAADGTERIENNDKPEGVNSDSIVMNRVIPETTADDSPSQDKLLQCLYPHRMTQFADLGKIFVIVCKLILLIEKHASAKSSRPNSKELKQSTQRTISEMREAIKSLRRNDNFPFPIAEACGQKRYNGHLAEHYVQFEKCIEDYTNRLQNGQFKGSRASVIRDQVVTDVFKVIRGETILRSGDSSI